MVSITFPADGITLNFFGEGELDVCIALVHALIQVGSDAPMIHYQ
jgi:hypothetical protein